MRFPRTPRTLNQFVCNSLAKFSAVPIRRNRFANVIQSSRHIGDRILIEPSKHIALDWFAGDPRQAAEPC